MYIVRILKKEEGYTLIEAIFQVVIFAMFAQLFVLFFYWKSPIEKVYKNNAELSLEMFAVDFQHEISQVEEIAVMTSGSGVRFKQGNAIIAIERNGRVIRKSVGGQGHVPLITNVVKSHFTLNYPQVTVHLQLEDGTSMERDFIVGTME